MAVNGAGKRSKGSVYGSHTLDIYDADLFLATTKPQWRALARRIPHLGSVPESAGLTSFSILHPKNGSLTVPVIVMWVDAAAHRDQANLVDTLAHEASHAAGALLNHVGHETKGIDEPHAYLVGWLTRWLWDHVEWTPPADA